MKRVNNTVVFLLSFACLALLAGLAEPGQAPVATSNPQSFDTDYIMTVGRVDKDRECVHIIDTVSRKTACFRVDEGSHRLVPVGIPPVRNLAPVFNRSDEMWPLHSGAETVRSRYVMATGELSNLVYIIDVHEKKLAVYGLDTKGTWQLLDLKLLDTVFVRSW